MNQMNLKTVLLILSFFLATTVFSQQPATLEWSTNYDDILNQAKLQKKPVLLFFHGSDWCPPCIKMQKEVFYNMDFIDFASEKILFLNVDFPYKNKLSDNQLKHNNQLKKKFGLPDEFTQGYPQVIIINQNAKVLYQEKGYNSEGTAKLIGVINKAVF